jgi:hypothetical protein
MIWVWPGDGARILRSPDLATQSERLSALKPCPLQTRLRCVWRGAGAPSSGPARGFRLVRGYHVEDREPCRMIADRSVHIPVWVRELRRLFTPKSVGEMHGGRRRGREQPARSPRPATKRFGWLVDRTDMGSTTPHCARTRVAATKAQCHAGQPTLFDGTGPPAVTSRDPSTSPGPTSCIGITGVARRPRRGRTSH